MSKTNLYLVRKEEAKVIQFASTVKLARNENLTVSRGELTQLLRDAKCLRKFDENAFCVANFRC